MTDSIKTAACPECGRPTIQSHDEKGTRILLDLIVPTYRIIGTNPMNDEPHHERQDGVYAPHAWTCKASAGKAHAAWLKRKT